MLPSSPSAPLPAVGPAGLRRRLREERRSLSRAERIRAGTRIAAGLWSLPLFTRCSRIACYLAVRGEVDCMPFIREGWRRGRRILVPVLHSGRLRFAPFRPDTRLVPNRYGIPEPAVPIRATVDPRLLDVVLAPVVAFDEAGHRMGMGAGYYDRTLRFLPGRGRFRRPHLIGVAYEFQKVMALTPQPWDVPLEAAVTDRATYFFGANRSR